MKQISFSYATLIENKSNLIVCVHNVRVSPHLVLRKPKHTSPFYFSIYMTKASTIRPTLILIPILGLCVYRHAKRYLYAHKPYPTKIMFSGNLFCRSAICYTSISVTVLLRTSQELHIFLYSQIPTAVNLTCGWVRNAYTFGMLSLLRAHSPSIYTSHESSEKYFQFE